MGEFAFHPELFEVRTHVIERLADAGLDWLCDFSSVDLLHDLYGLEVCGIRVEESALIIQRILQRMFPNWPYSRMYCKDHFSREPGWKVIISRDPEDTSDPWQMPQ